MPGTVSGNEDRGELKPVLHGLGAETGSNNRGGHAVLGGAIRDGLSKEVTSEQRPE